MRENERERFITSRLWYNITVITVDDERRTRKFPLATMGALATGSAHARPSAQAPIDTSRNLVASVK